MTLPRRAALVAGAVVAATVVAVTAAPSAHADTPQQQATALAAQVRSLQDQAEQATEQYDAAQGELGIVVGQKIAAERAVRDAQQAVAEQQQQNASTIRRVYEMGGPTSLYVNVLTGSGSLTDVQSGLAAVGRVVRAGEARSDALVAATAAAQQAVAHAAELTRQQTDLEAQVAAKAAAIQASITQTQGLLDAANAQVRALEAAAEAAREAAEQQQFLQAVAGAASGTLDTSARYANLLSGAPPASSAIAAAALANAEALEGHPYQWGGTGPVGYDCSGMTGAAYAAAGLRLPRTAAQQYLAGPHVPLADLQPGDLLFWASDPSNPATIDHVAIYAGKGLMVSANHTGDVVRLQPVWWNGFAGATRPSAPAAAAVPGPVWAPGQTA